MAVRGTRRQRRALLTVHVVASVGWLGVSLVMLTLGLFGRFADGRRGVEGGDVPTLHDAGNGLTRWARRARRISSAA